MKRFSSGFAVSSAWLCLGLAFSSGPIAYAQDRDPAVVQREQRVERLRDEARAFFAQVLNGQLEKLEECDISSQWLKGRVDEADAWEYFDLKAHADIVAPDHKMGVAEILDPKKLYPKIFCDESETAADDKSRFQTFEKAFGSDKKARLQIVWRSYSFPIFNDDYTRAAIWIEGHWKFWWSPHEAGSWEGGNEAVIYEKKGNAWERVTETDSAHWSGSVPPLNLMDETGR